MLILNLAAGKQKPLLEKGEGPHLLVNLDTSYYSFLEPDIIEESVALALKQGLGANVEYYCNEDAFTFMERTNLIFDRVCIYRFLEHVEMDKVLYFIYLLSTVTRKGAVVDIIVPNYEILARLILSECPYDKNFEAQNIRLTTELLNEPSCPHASIWTAERAQYFFDLEGRFKVESLNENFKFDGRDLYLRFKAERL